MAQPVLGFRMQIDGIDSIVEVDNKLKQLKVTAENTGKVSVVAFQDISSTMKSSLTSAKTSLDAVTESTNKQSFASKTLLDQFKNLFGGVKVFGVGMEELSKITHAQNILTSVKNSLLATEKVTTEGLTAKTVLQTAAQWALNAAKAAANPLLLALGAAAAVVGVAYKVLTDKSESAKKAQDRLSESWKTGRLELDELNEKINKSNQKELDLLKINGASKKELLDKEVQNIAVQEGQKLQIVQDNIVKAKKLQDAYLLEKDEKQKESLRSQIKDLLDENPKILKEIEDLQIKTTLAVAQGNADKKADNEKAAADKKSLDDKAASEQQALDEKASADRKKRSEDRIKLIEDENAKIQALEDQALINSIKDADDKAAVQLERAQLRANEEIDVRVAAAKKAGTLDLEEQKKFDEEKAALAIVQGQETEALLQSQADARVKLAADTAARIKVLENESAAANAQFLLDDQLAVATNEEEKLQIRTDFAVKEIERLAQQQQDELSLKMEGMNKESEEYKALQQKKVDIEKKASRDTIKIVSDNKKVQADLDAKDAAGKRAQLASNLGAAAELFGKQTAAYKVMKIAETTITTYSAATAALSPPPVGAGPILGPVFAAVAIATGIANIAKIAATPVPDKGSLSSDSSSTTPSRPSGSTYGMGGIADGASHANGGIATSIGEIEGGEAIINRQSTQMYRGILSMINEAGGGRDFGSPSRSEVDSSPMIQPIIKTYVVASDVTNQQEIDNKISRLARL